MTDQVSGELLIIADKIEAEANRIRAIARSRVQNERQKAMVAIEFIVGIPSRMELGNLTSCACYEELKRVKSAD